MSFMDRLFLEREHGPPRPREEVEPAIDHRIGRYTGLLPNDRFARRLLAAAGIFGVTKEPAARKYQVAGGYKIGGKLVPAKAPAQYGNADEDDNPCPDDPPVTAGTEAAKAA
jgi:hypothetical protein